MLKPARLSLFAIMLLGFVSCGRDDPLVDYKPVSQPEQAIKSVMMAFQDSANNKDAQQLEALIHDQATVMIGRERKILSKDEYIKILPQRLAQNRPLVLGRPKIKIFNDRAEVRLFLTRDNRRTIFIFNLVMENNHWIIKSWEF